LKILLKHYLLLELKKVTSPFCKQCMISNQHRLKFARVATRSKHVLNLINFDVWESSVLYILYHLLTITPWYCEYPIKKKSDIFPIFKKFKAWVKFEIGKRIKYLRTDNRWEYVDRAFLAFCKQEGITRQFYVPHTPQQNGVTKWMNRTFQYRTSAMLSTTRVTKSFG